MPNERTGRYVVNLGKMILQDDEGLVRKRESRG
jgi:hypothetical protein